MELDEVVLCKRCHRKLKDPEQRKLGFGKVCYKKQFRNRKIHLFEMGVNNETIK